MIIDVDRVTKLYGSYPALKEVTFSVHDTEIFGFLGPNGAGKTTTIRSIMQLIYPNSGTIWLFGEVISRNQTEHRQRIGYLPGDFKPPAEMKAAYFLDYVSRFRRTDPELREQLIKRFNLSAADLDKKLKYLSHGTRQKVGLVSAMEHNPDLIILDEPTLGLDPLIQEAFFEVLFDFKQKRKTVFLSSHILSEIERVCERVAIIRSGQIVVVKPIQELKKEQKRRLKIEFAKNFSGQPPKLPKTEFIKTQNNYYIYLTEMSSPDLIRELTKWPVKNFEFPEPELEDIFMMYYRSNEHD